MHLDWIILGLLLAQLVEDLFYSLYCFVLHALSTVGLFGDPSEGSSRLLLFTFSHSQKSWIFTICRVNQEYQCNIENSFLEVAWEQQQSDVKWGHEIKKGPGWSRDEYLSPILISSRGTFLPSERFKNANPFKPTRLLKTGGSIFD